MLIFIIASILLVLIYLWFIAPLKYWKVKGIPYVKPLPLLGNLADVVLQRLSFTEVIDEMYKLYPDARYFGIYQLTLPVLFIRDPELIGKIAIKEFDSFSDHRNIVPKETDSLWGNILFAKRRQDGWDQARAISSPTFTRAKMILMFPLMQKCVDQFIAFHKQGKDVVEVELKDATTRLINDILAVTLFGVTCDSLRHRKNKFYLMNKDATTITGWKFLKSFGFLLVPNLWRVIMMFIVFSNNVACFFRKLIQETVAMRKEYKIVRSDIIQLIMETHEDKDNGSLILLNRKKIKLNDDELTGLALSFLLAGYEPVSTLLAYTFYELAVNPEIQKKLHEEIENTVGTTKIDYEALMNMKYLDMIVSETLRKWTPTPATDRLCVKEFTLEPEHPWEKRLHLEVGAGLCIPIRAIHMDPKYHPNPHKFDPERFNCENKKRMKSFTYFPFGLGQRRCIGARFSLLESKLIIAEVIKHFEIVAIERTPIPIVLSKTSVHPVSDRGIWVQLKLRTNYNY